MKRSSLFDRRGCLPRVVGTGLVALDVVYNERQPEPIGRWTGGTCGNVLSILSWLGCSASPIAQLKPGTEATAIRKDLKRWNVKLDFINEVDNGSTPIILQYIQHTELGEAFHRFKMRCPVCGNRLPGFRPITGAAVAEMTPQLPVADAFYFDRVSRGILDLAAHYHKSGAVIVFEPSSIGEERHFEEALEMAHVVKFSNQRITASEVTLPDNYPSLYIETKGRKGLRFRCRFEKYRATTWQNVPAFDLPNICDAAGAGDWCTAGLIYRLAAHGIEEFKCQRKSDVFSAIQFGQAMSAWNCGFDGARGGMYNRSIAQFEAEVTAILNGEECNKCVTASAPAALTEFACVDCRDK